MIRVLSPPSGVRNLRVNDQSLVLSVALGATQILLTGDIEAAAEERLVTAAPDALRSAVLKVPHHGSHTSSHRRFVDAVAPRVAVISAGFENRFGFPHPEVVGRYRARRSALLRTDVSGAITVTVGREGGLAVRCQRAPRDCSVDSPFPQR
jgi:competence protein ComEC